MTDQFTYLRHRMGHLESRVRMLENSVRPRPGESDGPAPHNDLRTIQAVLWSIYDFVTTQSIGHTNDYKDIVEIKDDVSEIRSGIQTIIGLLGQDN